MRTQTYRGRKVVLRQNRKWLRWSPQELRGRILDADVGPRFGALSRFWKISEDLSVFGTDDNQDKREDYDGEELMRQGSWLLINNGLVTSLQDRGRGTCRGCLV